MLATAHGASHAAASRSRALLAARPSAAKRCLASGQAFSAASAARPAALLLQQQQQQRSARRQHATSVVVRAWGEPVEFTSAKVVKQAEVASGLHQVLLDVGPIADGYKVAGQYVQVKVGRAASRRGLPAAGCRGAAPAGRPCRGRAARTRARGRRPPPRQMGDSKAGFFAIASAPDANNQGVLELLIKRQGDPAELLCGLAAGAGSEAPPACAPPRLPPAPPAPPRPGLPRPPLACARLRLRPRHPPPLPPAPFPPQAPRCLSALCRARGSPWTGSPPLRWGCRTVVGLPCAPAPGPGRAQRLQRGARQAPDRRV
jgi:hypothetical protein